VARLRQDWAFSAAEMRDVVNASALDLVVATVAAGAAPAAARKWWTGELARWANQADQELEQLPISPQQVAAVQRLIDDGVINDKLARQVMEAVLAGEGEPADIVANRGWAVLSDQATLRAAVERAIAAQPEVATKIRSGKTAAAGALIGQVMKDLSGQADAGLVRQLILEILSPK
jgi:aspartyl-tRNA(Asn)/glutamyl-tRNA(Gln) amidotransferase subunit B